MLFWTEIGARARIGKAFMDGTAVEYIVTSDVIVPNGLAVDYDGEYLKFLLKLFIIEKVIIYL